MRILAATSGGEGMMMVFLVALVVAFIVVSVVMTAKAESAERLREVSRRLGAGFLPGSLFELPSLRVQVGPYPGRLSFVDGQKESTTLLLRVADYRGGSLEINPPGFFFGSRGVLIGDVDVHADPMELVNWIFAPQRRDEVLLTVRRLARYGAVSMALRAGSLEVRVARCLRDETPLRELQRTASEMVGYMLTPPGEQGIRWVETRALTGTCPVCSTAIATPVVVCPRCDVPHHEQCWDYLGRCAVYGCQPSRRAA